MSSLLTGCPCNPFIKYLWEWRRKFQKLLIVHIFSWSVQCKMGLTGVHNSHGLWHLFIYLFFCFSTFLCFTCVYESHFMCCYQGSTLWFELFSSTVYCMLLLITISWQLKTTSWQSCDGSMLRSLQVGRSSFHQVCPKVFFSLISHRISPQFLLSPFFMLCCN